MRLNYLGDQFRPNTVSFLPFIDNTTGQNISFVNLPVDQTTLVHRDLVNASSIPPGAPGPQTAAFGSTYVGAQNFPVSPDTPAKSVPDDSSYSAPTGGIVASTTLQVVGDQTGQSSLFVNMDDGLPNGPGSGVAIFDGTTSQDISLPVTSLGDAFHSEGASPCVPLDCTTQECPPVAPTPTPGTPTPTPAPPPGFLRELDSPNPAARSFGHALAMLDSTSDGAADVAVGAPGTTIGGNVNRGQAYLLSGSDGGALYTFDSSNPLPQGDPSSFGYAAAMGDATGDGRADVLIGAPSEDAPPNNAQGRAYLFDGATGGLLFAFDTPDPGFCCANFGSAVAMGDVSGDARADVAALGGGRVYVFSGTTGGLLLTLTAPGGSALGGGLAIGDIDGDLRGDIVAGGNEAVHVFSGATGTLIRTIGPNTSGGFGATVALGDASGDGTPDIAIGAPSALDSMGRSSGKVFLYSGATGAFLREFLPATSQVGLRFGDTLAAGDATGDGRADVLIGAWREAVGPNPEQGRAYLFNGATGALTLTLDSPNPQVNGHFSQGLAMGNVTGDARQEAVIGARDEDAGASTDRGRAYLFEFPFGGTATPTPSPTPTPGTPTATPTATPTPGPERVITFGNQLTQSVNDFHATFTRTVTEVNVISNAPGCNQPSGGAGQNHVDLSWSTTCVDPGESITLGFRFTNEDSILWCWFWTLDHQPFGDCPTPSPTPTATASPGPPTPTATATPSPTPTPATGHDARLTRIGGVPKNVRLSPGEVMTDSVSIVVVNQSDHADSVGVYVDVMAPPAGGCTPNGRVFDGTAFMVAGEKVTIQIPVSYSCSDPAAADGQSYAWVAVVDHGRDDVAACGSGSLQTLTCFNALADDDEDPADNRRSRTGPKVVAQ